MVAGVMPLADDAELPDGPRLSASDTSFRWLPHPYAFLDECAAHGVRKALDALTNSCRL